MISVNGDQGDGGVSGADLHLRIAVVLLEGDDLSLVSSLAGVKKHPGVYRGGAGLDAGELAHGHLHLGALVDADHAEMVLADVKKHVGVYRGRICSCRACGRSGHQLQRLYKHIFLYRKLHFNLNDRLAVILLFTLCWPFCASSSEWRP